MTEEEENDDNVPLEKAVLDTFTADMLNGCLEVLTGMPGTVFKACDVLSAVALRNGEEWKDNTMMHILEQVCLFRGIIPYHEIVICINLESCGIFFRSKIIFCYCLSIVGFLGQNPPPFLHLHQCI